MPMMMLLALMFAVAQEKPPAEQEEQQTVPVEPWPPSQDLRGLRPGFDPLHPVTPRPLDRGPLRISSNSLFHGLFGLLPMESAETLEEGRFEIGVTEDFSSGKLDVTTSDYFLRYDALLVETNLVARAGFQGDWELTVGVDASNLLEKNDDIILTRGGKVLIAEGRRSTTLGDLRLGAKKRILSIGTQGALGVGVGVKIPVSRQNEDLLSSGAVDFATTLLYSQEIGPFTLHVNVGAILPGDVQVFEEEVETRNALTFGTSVVYAFAAWGGLYGQVQGNQSLFEDSDDSIAILTDTVFTGHLGARVRLGSYVIDVSAGTGFGDQASELILTLGIRVPL